LDMGVDFLPSRCDRLNRSPIDACRMRKIGVCGHVSAKIFALLSKVAIHVIFVGRMVKAREQHLERTQNLADL
jgi:hypothetical protein